MLTQSLEITRLELAYETARASTDQSSQNGAVIVKDGRVIGRGANNFPTGTRWTEARALTRPTKYFYYEHAERWAILDACRRGKSTEGATMYCPWAACHDCARAIILSGIRTLVRHKQRMLGTPDSWLDSVTAGDDMMNEAGIEIIEYDGFVNAAPILANGQSWSPK